MIKFLSLIAVAFTILSCENASKNHEKSMDSATIVGTWELVSGTIVENGDTTLTDYTRNVRFIKVINDTHFTFLNHDLKKGADSTATFVAGGGKYSLEGNKYQEHLEFCNFREWEGHNFEFEVSIKGDTLVQQGIERIEDLGVERLNIEVYVRARE